VFDKQRSAGSVRQAELGTQRGPEFRLNADLRARPLPD
jgi:hypothetical protein